MANFKDVLYETLGEKIRSRRIGLGMNQSELSDRIDNIGRTSISNIEKGKQQPPLHIIYQICSVLDIDIHNILPTYSEIEQKLTDHSRKIKMLIEDSDIDENTRKLIEDFLKNS